MSEGAHSVFWKVGDGDYGLFNINHIAKKNKSSANAFRHCCLQPSIKNTDKKVRDFAIYFINY